MDDRSSFEISEVVGLDLGDKQSHICVMCLASGEVLEEAKLPTTERALERRFSTERPMRIAFEAGTHSPWVSELLERMGHEVIVANPRKLRLIYENRRKNDKVDAMYLAQLARVDSRLLAPITHRGPEARADLAVLHSRDAAIKARTKLINHVRGVVKSLGGRLPSCSSGAFGTKKMAGEIPDAAKQALLPILELVDQLTQKIRAFDRAIESLAREKYPEAVHLRQVGGVGPLISLGYVLTIEDPGRFKRSRSVGPYLGLVPGSDESGESSPQKRITKEGDKFLRCLLINGANHIIGSFGKDCDLRRHGLKICERGGKNAKKRATVAVARKLAVLMHSLWITGEEYDPFRNAKKSESENVLVNNG